MSLLTSLLYLTDRTFPYMLEYLLYTTIVISAGFIIEYFLRKKGAVLRSFTLQMTLLAVVILLPLSFMLNKNDAFVITVVSPGNIVRGYLYADRNTVDSVMHISRTSNIDMGGESLSQRKSEAVRTGEVPEKRKNSRFMTMPAREQNSQSPFVIGNNSILFAIVYITLPLTWCILSAFQALRFIMGLLYVFNLRYHSVPAQTHLKKITEKIAGDINISPPGIYRNPKVKRTLLFGFINPFILLPVWNFTNSMATKEVILHELAHLKRRDNVWNIISQLAKILIPVQPLLSILANRITDLADYVCDDFVVRLMSDRRGYANQLIHMADTVANCRYFSSYGIGFAEKKSQLRKRVERIMGRTHIPDVSIRFVQALPVMIYLLIPSAFAGIIGFSGEKHVAETIPYGPSEIEISTPISIEEFSRQVLSENELPKSDAGVSSQISKNVFPDSTSMTKGIVSSTVETPARHDISSASVLLSEPEKAVSSRVETEITQEYMIVSDNVRSQDHQTETLNDDTAIALTTEDSGNIVEQEYADTGNDEVNEMPVAENESKDLDSRTTIADQDTIKFIDGSFFPAAGSFNQGMAHSGSSFDPDNFTGREVISIDIPDSDDLPILEQLFYYSTRQSQESPVWSRDGKTIAFSGQAGMGIWLVSAAGGAPELICENYHEYEFDGKGYASYGSLTPLAFSPDGSEIYFHDYSLYADGHVEVGGGSRGNTNPKIKAVNIATGEVRTLIEKALFGGCFTSDGRICVYRKIGDTYNSSLGLFARDLVSGEEWLLAYYGRSACITPDDSDVIYSMKQNGVSQLYRVSINGGHRVQLTFCTENDTCWKPSSPQCTPDGKWLVFLAEYNDWIDASGFYAHSKVNYFGLCAMSLDTCEIIRLSPDSAYNIESAPRIAPDCSRIILGAAQLIPYSSDDVPSGRFSELQLYSFSESGTGKIASPSREIPVPFTIKGNHPNPFNMSTTIDFSLNEKAFVEIAIFNTLGQQIRTLVGEEYLAGSHSVIWDGFNDQGSPVSSGVYITRLKMKGRVTTHRMTLAK